MVRRKERITGNRPQEFAEPLVDASTVVRFRIDGKLVTGHVGDTVLSALLASGIDTLGHREGHPVGLSEHCAPPVAHRSNVNRPDLAVPMALCPAAEGMDLVTLAPKARPRGLARLAAPFSRARRSLGIDLDSPALEPWRDSEIERSYTVDCVVVGGGLAGMAAALASARAGRRTILIEGKQVLGGYARYFGRAEGDPDPAEAVAEHAAALARDALASVWLSTLVTRLVSGAVETVSVTSADGVPYPLRCRIAAPMIVIATGTAELLPAFPGNRLPGVMLSTSAWSLAHRFSLWRGATALVHTSANTAYRLALLGSDCGVKISEASDTRIAPQSRFIEFCKAFGFRLRWGAAISGVRRSGSMLEVLYRDLQTDRTDEMPELVDAVIVSGGFVPELSLWIAAGGQVDITPSGAVALGDPPFLGVGAAGFAAGYQSHSGALASGRRAIARLLGGAVDPVEDLVFDPHFETPQVLYPPPAHRQKHDAPAYYGSGLSHSAASFAPGQTRLARFMGRRPAWPSPLDRHPLPLGLDDCIGMLAAGAVPHHRIGRLVAERCVPPLRLTPAAEMEAPAVRADPRAIPPFLHRRFGRTQHIWHLAADDDGALRRGALIYPSAETGRPIDAIGVVLGEVPSLGTVGLFGAGRRKGEALFVRDGAALHPISLIARAEKA